MHESALLIALALLLGGLVVVDHLRTIKKGRSRKFSALPEKQPGGFRRSFYSAWTVMGFCLGVIVYALLWGF
jgi:hypothetical protein